MGLLRPVWVEAGRFKLAFAGVSLKGDARLREALEEFGPKPLPRSMGFRYIEMVETPDPYLVAEVFQHEKVDDSGPAASDGEQEAAE